VQRYCICGKPISNNRRLCKECGDNYGYNPDNWPEWLRWLVNDMQRSIDQERNHTELSLDEIESDGDGIYRAKRAFALRGCRTETHLYEDRDKH
jgi:hypothetical protein